MAGNGPLPEGLLMVTENEMDLPASETLIVRRFPEKEPVTDEGFGGKVPRT